MEVYATLRIAKWPVLQTVIAAGVDMGTERGHSL